MRGIAYKWIVLSVTTIGSFMAAIDATIVILALPVMMVDLHADLVTMIWVIMGYLLVSTFFLLSFGRVADMFGRVRMYNLGFVIFAVGSAFCGFSWNATILIIARLIQGSGAAMLVVNSVAIITEVFPPTERGKALGINSITWSSGGIFGPILGGVILSFTSWRWIFFINVPIGIAGSIWGYVVLKETSHRTKGEKFDFFGAFSFSFGLLALLLALTQGIAASWLSWWIIALFIFFIVMIVSFFYWEGRAAHPVLDLSLFSSRTYTFAVLAAMMQALAIFAVNFMIIFYLLGVKGLDPLTASLLIIPLPLLNAVSGPLSGRLSDRIGARVPGTVGLFVQAVALFLLTLVSAETPYFYLAIGLAIMGLGGGMFYSPNTSSAMSAAPGRRLGVASATLATLRQTGMVTSFALSLAVAAASMPREVMLSLFVGVGKKLSPAIIHDYILGMRAAFYVSIGLCVMAILLSWYRGKSMPSAG
jgi:EmrB/QacA subfamily drug resistance transporter